MLAASVAVLVAGATVLTSAPTAHAALFFEVPSLDGSGNNTANPNWGRAGQNYTRVAAARYADGRSAPVPGPNARAVSNRIFNDSNIATWDNAVNARPVGATLNGRRCATT
jgi:hypothetical protein